MTAVSVILPTHDRERFLRQAIASVFAQSHTDWELLVVDDGSTDATPEILEAIPDPRLRTLRRRRPSGGAAVPRNLGLAAATGEWVAFLDSDDLWHPAKLARQLAALAASGADWCYTGFEVVDAAAIPTGRFGRATEAGWIAPRLRASGDSVALGSVVARRALAPRFCRWITHVEDVDWVWRLAETGRATAVDALLLKVREHPGRSGTERRAPIAGRLLSWWLVYLRAAARARSVAVWRQMLVRGAVKSRHVLAITPGAPPPRQPRRR